MRGRARRSTPRWRTSSSLTRSESSTPKPDAGVAGVEVTDAVAARSESSTPKPDAGGNVALPVPLRTNGDRHEGRTHACQGQERLREVPHTAGRVISRGWRLSPGATDARL